MDTPPADHQPQLPDWHPGPHNPGSNRRIISGSLVVLVALIAVTSYFAFRAGPGAFGGGTKSGPGAPAAIAPAVVDITKNGFVPATVSVKIGQAVAWTNTDSTPHAVLSDAPTPISKTDPLPDSQQPFGQNDTYSYIFDKAGTYGYHDSRSPNFRGTVVVQ